MKKLVLFGVFLFFLTISLYAQHWIISELSPMPQATSNNAVSWAEVNGITYIYSFCGIDTSKKYSGIHLKSYRYNLNQNLWEAIPDVPDTLGKIAAAASRVKDTIYIIGGYHVMPNGYEYSSNKVHRFNVKSNTFMNDGTNIPTPIDDHVQAVWRDSLIFVITGWSGAGFSGGNVGKVQIYNPYTDTWSQGTPVPNNNIYKSFGASGIIIGDTIYYYGGANGSSFNVQNQVRKGVINPSDPTQISWSYFIPDAFISGYRMAAIHYNNLPYWLGGSSNTYNYDGIAYDGSGGVPPANRSLKLTFSQTWDTAHHILPMDLRNAAIIDNGVIILAGGMYENQQVSDKTLYLMAAEKNQTQNISENNISVFPNPIGEELSIKLPGKPVKITLLNLLFEEINSFETHLSFIKMDVSDFPAGTYFIQITNLNNKENIFTRKLIKL